MVAIRDGHRVACLISVIGIDSLDMENEDRASLVSNVSLRAGADTITSW